MFGDWLGLVSGFIFAPVGGSPRAPLHLNVRAKRVGMAMRVPKKIRLIVRTHPVIPE